MKRDEIIIKLFQSFNTNSIVLLLIFYNRNSLAKGLYSFYFYLQLNRN